MTLHVPVYHMELLLQVCKRLLISPVNPFSFFIKKNNEITKVIQSFDLLDIIK